MNQIVSRRRFLTISGATLAGIALAGCDRPSASPPPALTLPPTVQSLATLGRQATPSVSTSPPTAAPTTIPPRQATAPSLRRTTPPPLPADGPWNRDLMFVSSADGGMSFSAPRPWLERAGLPCMARLAPNRMAAVFQWFADSPADFDRVAIRFTTDEGQSWTEPKRIEIAGLPPTYQRPYEPALVALPDGRVRLYFSSDVAIGIGAGIRTPATYSGVGTDGVRYEFETGARFEQAGKPVTDPAVARFGKSWHLVAPTGRPQDGAYHATSNDGLDFAPAANLGSDGEQSWAGNLLEMDGALRFYGGSARGIWWASSSDGTAWTPPVYTGLQGSDPAVALTAADALLMIYVADRMRRTP